MRNGNLLVEPLQSCEWLLQDRVVNLFPHRSTEKIFEVRPVALGDILVPNIDGVAVGVAGDAGDAGDAVSAAEPASASIHQIWRTRNRNRDGRDCDESSEREITVRFPS